MIVEKNAIQSLGCPKKRVKLITCGTDKYMWIRCANTETFEISRSQQFNERILAMDITHDSSYILTVHDRFM